MNRNLDLLLAILPGVKKMVLVALENFFLDLKSSLTTHRQTHQLATSTCCLNQTYFVVLHVKTESKIPQEDQRSSCTSIERICDANFTFKDTKKLTRTVNYTTTHFQIISLASLHRQALQPRITHIRLGEVTEVDLLFI